MAGLLLNQLNSNGIEILNLTSAHFETGDEAPGTDMRPVVRTVRFEGAHLLDSRPACQLLVDGRALVGVAALVRHTPNRGEHFTLPIQISVEKEHLAVLTGFGSERPEVANSLQAELVKRVRGALMAPLDQESGVIRESAVEDLAGKMEAMLRREGPVERATFFAPEESWEDLDA